jgi:NAD(P)-dependent dehydrogenase (short-subunit alcohol dehydrogenase family)
VATRLCSDGYGVVVCDVKDSTAFAHSIGAAFHLTDVSNELMVKDAVALAVSKYGTLRGAVSCAGVGVAQKVLSKKGVHSLESFSKVININLVGTFNVARLVADQLAKQAPYNADGERGVLIHTASIAAMDGQIGQAAYSASKGGVVGMMLPLAREFSQVGIRVVTVAPGLFDTPLLAGLPEPARMQLAASVPFPKRLGNPSEFASLVSQIVHNPMLNGEVIRLDGSLRMQ